MRNERECLIGIGRLKWISGVLVLLVLAELFAGCGFAPAAAKQKKASSVVSRESGCVTSPILGATAASDHQLYVNEGSFAQEPLTASIIALDTRSGRKVWQASIGRLPGSFLQVVGGVVYVALSVGIDGLNTVLALDSKSGKRLWSFTEKVPLLIESMIVCSSAVYLRLGDSAGKIVSVEARRMQDGGLLWQHTMTMSVSGTVISVAGRQFAVSGDGVYIGIGVVQDEEKCRKTHSSQDCQVISVISALNSANGQERWHSEKIVDIYIAVITASNKAVYAIKAQGVEALRARDGLRLWDKGFDALASGTIDDLVLNGALYMNVLGGVMAVNEEDGKLLWMHEGGYVASLKAGDGWIYTTNDGSGGVFNFCALNVKDGKIRWCSTAARTSTETAGDAEVVYTAATPEGIVHALRKGDGSEVWRYTLENAEHRVSGVALEK